MRAQDGLGCIGLPAEERAGEGFFNLGFWNLVASIGSLILGIGVLLFVINIWHTHWSKNRPGPAPLDPWDARSLGTRSLSGSALQRKAKCAKRALSR